MKHELSPTPNITEHAIHRRSCSGCADLNRAPDDDESGSTIILITADPESRRSAVSLDGGSTQSSPVLRNNVALGGRLPRPPPNGIQRDEDPPSRRYRSFCSSDSW